MSIPQSEWKWFGNAAHFIAGRDCKFHLATKIGDYLISTVSEYFPSGTNEMSIIGYKRTYETMVFRVDKEACDCGCGLPTPVSYSEIDMEGYNDAKGATEGHLNMCLRWANPEHAKECANA